MIKIEEKREINSFIKGWNASGGSYKFDFIKEEESLFDEILENIDPDGKLKNINKIIKITSIDIEK